MGHPIKYLLTLLLVSGIGSAQIVVTTSQYGKTFTEPVTVGTTQSITFYECSFTCSSVLITAGYNQSVTCQNCTFKGINPNVYGAPGAVGIWAIQVAKLYLLNCQFSNLRIGVFEDANWSSPDLNYWCCTFEHNNIRLSDGNGGWLNEIGWGFSVCFMHTRGYNTTTHAFKITDCDFVNDLGVDVPGDQLNVYESSGLIASNNTIKGAKGFIGNAVNDNGIVTDDEWADNRARYGQPGDYKWTTYNCVFENNTLIDASIGIWAGHDNQVIGNRVINSGKLATGGWSTVPQIGIGRYAPEGAEWAATNTVTGNQVSSVFQGQPYTYDNQAGSANWSANTSFK